MNAIGYKKWVIPCGCIPFKSTGREPELLSQDKIAVLNLNRQPVKIRITVYYTDEEPVEYKPVVINGERVRKIRVNDLINPFPVVLDKEYSLVIEAEEPVVVQFLRMNTGHRNLALMGTIAFGTTE
jgi:hypothetical protein